MPKRQLTDRFCQHAKPHDGEVQTDYYDASQKGLALRVSGRSRTWTYFFSWEGKRVRMGLGTYPATSLAKARTLADEASAALGEGKDPRSALAAPTTLKAICQEWYDREGKALRTGETRRATLERLVYPTLGNRPVAEIRRSEIIRLLDGIEDGSGAVQADMVLAYIRRVFNWFASRSDDFRSPIVRGMARTKPIERARKRTLTDEELRDLCRALAVADVPECYRRFIRMLLLCACRRSEVADMHSREVEADVWTIPASRYKTKLDHAIPLTPQARELIGAAPSGFIFSTTGGATPLHDKGDEKRALDKAVATLRDADGRAPMPHWTIHDLRRTARSLMSRAGIDSNVAERCLGHVIGGVRGTYDRHEYRDEKAEALAKLARLLDRIVSGRPTVVTLQRVERVSAGD